jgi:hypothetical protein
MADLSSETKAWMVKAWRDLETARRVAGSEPPFYDIAVYHCQQASEKATLIYEPGFYPSQLLLPIGNTPVSASPSLRVFPTLCPTSPVPCLSPSLHHSITPVPHPSIQDHPSAKARLIRWMASSISLVLLKPITTQ